MKNYKIILIFLLLTQWAIAQKPNIVFILADDLGYGDLACFGSKIIKTPHLDALAKDGIKLTQFYSGSTVCAPSRAALMSGLHTGHGYIRGNGETPLRKQDIILPQLLKKAGYNTAMFGKWGLGDVNTEGSVEKKGWDEFFGLIHHVEAHFQVPSVAWKYTQGMKQVTRIRMESIHYAPAAIADNAVKYIKKQSADKPFFVYLPLPIPHAQLYAPDEAMKQYQDAKGNSIFEEKEYFGNHYQGQKTPKAAYAAMVSLADDYLGQVVKALKDKGLYENTIIVFTSDNGTHVEGGRTKDDVKLMNSSGGLKGVKRDLTEGGIRVPTIVAGAGLPKNIEREGYGAFWDFLPTFMEAANTKAPKNISGTSQWNYWKTGNGWQSRPLYWEFFEGGNFQALRQDDWKYIKSITPKGDVKEELYDLKADRSESQNLATTNTAQLKIMAELCQKQHTLSVNPIFRMYAEKGDK